MTAYAPRHAVTAPRTYRAPLWRRARRVLLSLLPARTVAVPLADEEPLPFWPGPQAIEHRALTDAEIAALTPVWAVRRDGLITVTASGAVEVYPAPLAWEPSTRVTAAMPAVSRTDHEELPREFEDHPGVELLRRVIAGLRAIPEQGDYGTMAAERVIAAEQLAKGLIA